MKPLVFVLQSKYVFYYYKQQDTVPTSIDYNAFHIVCVLYETAPQQQVVFVNGKLFTKLVFPVKYTQSQQSVSILTYTI